VDIQCVSRDLTPLDRGEEGVIRIRSRSLGRPYDDNLFPEPDGEHWFYPGDTGYLNEHGLLILTGRTDNVINIGGFKLSPELIEDHLISHGKIADAAVFKTEVRDGLPPRLLVAIVANEDLGDAQIREWCARGFPDVEIGTIARVASIPRTEFGKVARDSLTASLS